MLVATEHAEPPFALFAAKRKPRKFGFVRLRVNRLGFWRSMLVRTPSVLRDHGRAGVRMPVGVRLRRFDRDIHRIVGGRWLRGSRRPSSDRLVAVPILWIQGNRLGEVPWNIGYWGWWF